MTSTEMTPELRAYFIDRDTKAVRRFIRATNRWFAYCRQDLPRDAKRPRNPSKASKAQAYSTAGSLARLLGVEAPHTYADMCALVGLPDLRGLEDRFTPRNPNPQETDADRASARILGL